MYSLHYRQSAKPGKWDVTVKVGDPDVYADIAQVYDRLREADIAEIAVESGDPSPAVEEEAKQVDMLFYELGLDVCRGPEKVPNKPAAELAMPATQDGRRQATEVKH